MLAEAMRQMANREDRHVRQGPEPNQYSSFKDFMDTKLPIFREAEEPLQADEWRTILWLLILHVQDKRAGRTPNIWSGLV